MTARSSSKCLVFQLSDEREKSSMQNGYTGDRVAGRMEGEGRFRFADGSYYEGNFKDGM